MGHATAFDEWLDTFIDEKELDREVTFIKDGPIWGMNIIPFAVLIEAIKSTSTREQAAIRNALVAIDFRNGDTMAFFDRLAGSLAR